MEPADCTSPDASAFRVAAALERYQAAVALFLRDAAWAHARQELARTFSALRLECAGLPAVNVRWAALLISHFEILSLLPPGAPAPKQVAGHPAPAQVQRHQSHIEALARECRSLMRGRRQWRPARRMHGFGRPA